MRSTRPTAPSALQEVSTPRNTEGYIGRLEDSYGTLLESAPDAILISDQSSRILLVNAETERLYGYSRAELIGQPITMLMPKRFWQKGAKYEPSEANDLRRRPISRDLELSGLRKDNTEFPIEFTLRHVETPNGTVYFSAIRDISERKMVEEALRASEERFRHLVTGVEDYAMLTLDPSGHVVTWNIGAARLKGYSTPEILGRHFALFYTAEDIEAGKPEANLVTAATRGRAIDEGWRVKKDGSRFWAEVAITALHDDAGVLRGFAKLTRDVTARKSSEEALRASDERHRMAVEVAELGSWRGDFACDEISYSETFGTIFDLPSGTMLRRPDIYRYIHPDDREEVIARSKDAVERGVPYEFEYRILRANGTVRWVTAKGRIERSPDGANVASLGVVMDITERKQAQEVLKNRLMQERQAEELMRSNAELQQFAYVAAHDLQEPLRMVASYTQLLAQRYKGHLDADADDFIAFAVDGAHRMQALIADLLAYCRVETTGRQFQETSSGDALKQALHNLQGTIEGSGGVVTMDALPVVVGDEAQLIQLFQNVVGNAIKYRGTEPPRVHVTASRKAGEWVFMVRDNGIGIDPQYFEKIFVMFQRLHRRDEYSGTGIGLSLCKKIVERHDGRIWVESSPGIGSTFFIALPEVRPT